MRNGAANNFLQQRQCVKVINTLKSSEWSKRLEKYGAQGFKGFRKCPFKFLLHQCPCHHSCPQHFEMKLDSVIDFKKKAVFD